MWWLLTAVAHASYGVPVDGIPHPAEREVFVWTNAVRTDPEAFRSAYECDFDGFEEGEKTPKAPLLWHDGLGEAARFHSVDMHTHDHFSHSSSDGTPAGTRIRRYYPTSNVGENIAYGYPDPYAVVLGWMCSTGHRANIMTPDWEELGTGISGKYTTQDFGRRGVSPLERPLAMGAHTPTEPGAEVEYLLNVHALAAPSKVEVVVNGEPVAMELGWGVPSQGTWRVRVATQPGCNRYAFRAQLADGVVVHFPEVGSFGFGPCAYTDEEAQWIRGAAPPDPPGLADTAAPHFGIDGTDDDDVRFRDAYGCGCAHGSGAAGLLPLALLGLLVRRRR